MLPEAFKERIQKQQYINAEELLRALDKPSDTTIRINRNKWHKNPLNSEVVPWCKDGFYLEERPSFTLDPLFHAGCYYSQEASGMFLEQVFKQLIDKGHNIKVLDLCGAPGGKSTHLSSLIGQRGLLVANEVIRQRASVLAENLTKWGLSNTIVTQSDPSAFGRMPDFFDLILVDAPCSGEGMFCDGTAVKEWSVANTELCSERQKRILMDIWPALKENGILIYSTCTFNPCENEKNIKWFTGKHLAESLRLDISDYEGITEIDYQGIYGYGFYPGRIRGEGLFISVLKKTEKQKRSDFRYKSGKERRITREEKAIAEKWTLFLADNLIKIGDNIISAAGSADDYFELSERIKLIKSGTIICTIKKKNYIPSHELAMSVNFRKHSFPEVNLDTDQALAYLAREHIKPEIVQNGWNIVCYKGVSLGFVNNIGSRINNYYPVEWHIRMSITGTAREDLIEWK